MPKGTSNEFPLGSRLGTEFPLDEMKHQGQQQGQQGVDMALHRRRRKDVSG